MINKRQTIKEWLSGKPSGEYHQGLILSVGTKYVTWLSLFENEKPVKIDIDDFYDVITDKTSFSDILIEAQRPVYTSPISQAASALGKIKTPKKAAASRENGKKGGRPKNNY